MTDDEQWHVLPNGVRVNGISRPRIIDGVDTFTGERLGPEDLLPEETEAQSIEHRRQRTASFFHQPKWTVDLVVSWIGYRDASAIDVPFEPKLWKHSRPAIKAQPRLALLHALQNGDLQAIRHRVKSAGRVSLEEWFNVEDHWSVDRWPECAFARADVLNLWPETPAVAGHDLVPTQSGRQAVLSTEAPGQVTIEVTEAPIRRPRTIADVAVLKKAIRLRPVQAGLNRDEWHVEIERRLQELGLGKKADRGATRELHSDPSVYPGRPGKGPHRSAGSLGKK